MESGKSPGIDGHPAEFCKVFCKDVSPFLISSLNRSYKNENLAITQRRGIISYIQIMCPEKELEIGGWWKDYNYKDVGCIPTGLHFVLITYVF